MIIAKLDVDNLLTMWRVFFEIYDKLTNNVFNHTIKHKFVTEKIGKK
jgi:hypothetical protein